MTVARLRTILRATAVVALACSVLAVFAPGSVPREPGTEPHRPLPALAQRLPDAHYLQHVADSAALRPSLLWGLAWTESRANLKTSLRGHHCKTLTNCERGRYQIKPRTAAARCPKLDTRTYEGNVACAAKMLSEDGGGEKALRIWIGRGLGEAYRTAYVNKVLALVGRMEVGR